MWSLVTALLCLVMMGIVANCQDPPDCSGFTVDNLPRPRLLLLGPTGQAFETQAMPFNQIIFVVFSVIYPSRTGVGKSTLGNFLLGNDPRGENTVFRWPPCASMRHSAVA